MRFSRLIVLLLCTTCGGCRPRALPVETGRQDPAASSSLRIVDWHAVPELREPLARFETVFWDSADTISLRHEIAVQGAARDRRVLEIGAGTGLLSLCCLTHGAASVVATDVNPTAVACTSYNAERLGVASRLHVRQVSLDDPAAFAVIGADERFELIVSNPPWEDDVPERIDDFALYDPGFLLLQSLLTGLPRHLTPDGRALLAYGCVEAIRTVQSEAPRHGLTVRVLDDRRLDELPPVFVPGMLLELRPAGQD